MRVPRPTATSSAVALTLALLASSAFAARPLLPNIREQQVFEGQVDCDSFYLRLVRDDRRSATDLNAIVENACRSRFDQDGVVEMIVDGDVVGSAPLDRFDGAGLHVVVARPLSTLRVVELRVSGVETSVFRGVPISTPFEASFVVPLK